jgi:hypothetical protein
MYNHWVTDLNISTKALLKIENTYLPKLISGKIHSIESKDNEILILLDQKSGIDLIRENNIGLQGIASRIQFDKAYNTFTIRKERFTGAKTEYEKRLEQMNNGYFYPEFTMQLYFNNRIDLEFLSGGIIRTKNLYQFIENNPDKIFIKKSDNFFYVVKFKDLIDMGIKIIEKKIDNKLFYYPTYDIQGVLF